MIFIEIPLHPYLVVGSWMFLLWVFMGYNDLA